MRRLLALLLLGLLCFLVACGGSSATPANDGPGLSAATSSRSMVLYSLTPEGDAVAYSVGPDGDLSELNRVRAEGAVANLSVPGSRDRLYLFSTDTYQHRVRMTSFRLAPNGAIQTPGTVVSEWDTNGYGDESHGFGGAVTASGRFLARVTSDSTLGIYSLENGVPSATAAGTVVLPDCTGHELCASGLYVAATGNDAAGDLLWLHYYRSVVRGNSSSMIPVIVSAAGQTSFPPADQGWFGVEQYRDLAFSDRNWNVVLGSEYHDFTLVGSRSRFAVGHDDFATCGAMWETVTVGPCNYRAQVIAVDRGQTVVAVVNGAGQLGLMDGVDLAPGPATTIDDSASVPELLMSPDARWLYAYSNTAQNTVTRYRIDRPSLTVTRVGAQQVSERWMFAVLAP